MQRRGTTYNSSWRGASFSSAYWWAKRRPGFMERGISGTAGAPLDVSGRLGIRQPDSGDRPAGAEM